MNAVWVGDLPQCGDLQLLVAPAGNGKWQGLERRLLTAQRCSDELMASMGVLPPWGGLTKQRRERIIGQLLLETSLRDWRGLMDGDDPVPYSRKLAEQLL